MVRWSLIASGSANIQIHEFSKPMDSLLSKLKQKVMKSLLYWHEICHGGHFGLERDKDTNRNRNIAAESYNV